jgi:hypothetical protein
MFCIRCFRQKVNKDSKIFCVSRLCRTKSLSLFIHPIGKPDIFAKPNSITTNIRTWEELSELPFCPGSGTRGQRSDTQTVSHTIIIKELDKRPN